MELPESVQTILANMRDAGAGSTADELAAALAAHEPPAVEPQYTAAEMMELIMTEARADVLRENARADRDTEVIDAAADAGEQVIEAEAEADAEVIDAAADAEAEVTEAEADATAEVIDAAADAEPDPEPLPSPEPEGPEPTEQHWATRSWSGWKLGRG